MIKARRNRYYIDEEVLLMKVKGGNKRTGAGGLVTKAQKAATCRTCFALIAENHYEFHIKIHFRKPIDKGMK